MGGDVGALILRLRPGRSTCGGPAGRRSVLGAVAGACRVPLSGDGDLLARNLGIPRRAGRALDVAIGGRCRVLDVGIMGDELFVGMAGIGFDAAMVGAASVALKRRIGWPAYVVSGIQQMRRSPVGVTVRLDDEAPLTRRARGVVVGNVGRLQGGARLFPSADPGDGQLDVAVLSPVGLTGWLRLISELMLGVGGGNRVVERFRARRVEVSTSRPQTFEVDGDAVDEVTAARIAVEPQALRVMVSS